MYGMSEAAVVTEESPLDPKTEYARSKVKSERAIASLAEISFSPTFMRNGTIYGVSPRMRFDTVFNDLIGAAVTTGKVTLYSDGKPWRPVVHVARCCARISCCACKRPLPTYGIKPSTPGRTISIIRSSNSPKSLRIRCRAASSRSWRSRAPINARIKPTSASLPASFPNFSFNWTAKEGARELYETFKTIGLTYDNFIDKRFTRLKWLRYLLDTGQLNSSLRWNSGLESAA